MSIHSVIYAFQVIAFSSQGTSTSTATRFASSLFSLSAFSSLELSEEKHQCGQLYIKANLVCICNKCPVLFRLAFTYVCLSQREKMWQCA